MYIHLFLFSWVLSEEEEEEDDVSIIASGVLCFLFLKALKI